MKLMGLRSIKTIIAVVIGYVIALFFPALNPAMMGAAAITAVNSSIFTSFRSSFDRVMANITAVMTAFLLQYIKLVNPLGVAIGLLIIITVCNTFDWKYVIGSASIFFVFVLDVPYGNRNLQVYAFNRILDTLIGSFLGLMVNAYVFRPRQDKFLLSTYRDAYKNLRKGFKDLLEFDKSVDEFELIDKLSKINFISQKLRKDIRLKMNEDVNIVTVFKLNNLFRSALSLIIELNDLDEVPIISEKNYKLLLNYFKGDFNCPFKVDEIKNDFDTRYNFELEKLIYTLESIEYNLYEYTKMYNKQKNKWYLETK